MMSKHDFLLRDSRTVSEWKLISSSSVKAFDLSLIFEDCNESMKLVWGQFQWIYDTYLQSFGDSALFRVV